MDIIAINVERVVCGEIRLLDENNVIEVIFIFRQYFFSFGERCGCPPAFNYKMPNFLKKVRAWDSVGCCGG